MLLIAMADYYYETSDNPPTKTEEEPNKEPIKKEDLPKKEEEGKKESQSAEINGNEADFNHVIQRMTRDRM
jgi:hypothetical protein